MKKKTKIIIMFLGSSIIRIGIGAIIVYFSIKLLSFALASWLGAEYIFISNIVPILIMALILWLILKSSFFRQKLDQRDEKIKGKFWEKLKKAEEEDKRMVLME